MARVFCGLHFPLDVAGSFGVAVLAVIVVTRLNAPLQRIDVRIVETYTAVVGRLSPAHTGMHKEG